MTFVEDEVGEDTTQYRDTVKQLDWYYGLIKRQLLRHQSPTTGDGVMV